MPPANASLGDMCTPEGDFEIWLKYPSQNMSGTSTLSDGKKETWDAERRLRQLFLEERLRHPSHCHADPIH